MIKVASIPDNEQTCDDFSVVLNGKINVPCYTARVSAIPYNTIWPGKQRTIEHTEIASFVSFETDEPVTLRLEVKKPFSEAVIRPLSYKITPVINGKAIEFTITHVAETSENIKLV